VNPLRALPRRHRHTTAIDVRPFRFERRAEGRRSAPGEAMAAFFDEDGALSLTRVRLVDFSEHGVGLVCPVEVEAGARFCLYSDLAPLPHTTGFVVRCDPDGEDWRMGLRCDSRRAA
jgi:hypothetical protein